MLTIICPVCGRVVADMEMKCSGCGTDLEAYISLSYTPDLLFNEAAELLLRKEYYAAIDKLAVAHYLRPADKEIVMMMARAAESAGNPMLAMEKMAVLLADDDNASEQAQEEFMRLNTAYEQLEKDRELDKTVTELSGERFAEFKDIIKRAVRESVNEMKMEVK